MIERQTLGGRPATVAYLTAEMEPADKEDAELIKVIYDDGERLWLVPKRVADPDADAADA